MSLARNALVAAIATVSASSLASAATLYSDSFNTDTSANWTVNNGSGNNDATFAYDYSALGIPAAPGSTDTLGLRLRANMAPAPTPAVQGGISVSPTGQSFTGDYVVKFQAWQNAPGPFPAGGSGSTQLLTYSLGTAGTTVQRPGSVLDGVMVASSTDGGTASDYRVYAPGASGAQVAIATGTYSAGTATNAQDNLNAYYASFGSKTPPAAQAALFPTQTGTTAVGTQAFAWHSVEYAKVGNTITWTIDGVRIATLDLTANNVTLTGSNIALGQADINTGVTTADPLLLFGLVDNLTVQSIVPEPTTLAALAGVGAVMLRRRRTV